VYEIEKKIPQELQRGPLLILLMNARNQKGNPPGAPQRASAYIPYWKWKKSVRE
jgi:hypothetical protein